jgi:hypothetical protein
MVQGTDVTLCPRRPASDVAIEIRKWDPLIRPSRAPDGRWTVDAWAPLDGININGGVRFAF